MRLLGLVKEINLSQNNKIKFKFLLAKYILNIGECLK